MRRRLALMGLLPVVLVVVVGCGDADPDPPGGPVAPPPAAQGTSNTYIASLAIDPADGTLFLGAADGLYRRAPGRRDAERITGSLEGGQILQSNTGSISRLLVVGFARAGELLASGHPEPGGTLPEDLGLIRSTDGGRTWRPVSLLGKADFHVLHARGARVVAVGAEEAEVRVSANGRRTFDARALPGVAVDLAVDPGDPARMVLTTQRGLFTSLDAGRGWRPGQRSGDGGRSRRVVVRLRRSR